MNEATRQCILHVCLKSSNRHRILRIRCSLWTVEGTQALARKSWDCWCHPGWDENFASKFCISYMDICIYSCITLFINACIHVPEFSFFNIGRFLFQIGRMVIRRGFMGVVNTGVTVSHHGTTSSDVHNCHVQLHPPHSLRCTGDVFTVVAR